MPLPSLTVNEIKGFSQFLDRFWFIRGQSVTQRSMGGEAPRYPPHYPGGP